ncbi:ABC transporter substrate-binding protein [Microbispora sp. ATCC PTA-5024]|uniref:ABC transporter substrate-binding protein n=1 Tax=Microbispora sp. ATCC PTA-5024 TaxID=316330 RepID=UPI0003DBFE20|nr:sugar ABC transporter substrate-binding protein [Microbispora sp. ATCC PTA-5024]ETK35752.1 sugar-binding protein [Microbispora sp. ATCC PTA-5024]
MKMKVAGAALAVLAVAATGCGSGSGPDGSGKTTITFWDNNGGTRTPVYQELIKRFEKANPSIHVEYVGVPIASVQQKYDTAIAGGDTPDVGGVTTSYLANLVGQQALEPADGWLAKSAVNGRIAAPMLDSVRRTAADGKLYLVPNTSNMDVVWYLKDLLPTPPQTWDQFFADADRLTKAPDRYGYTIRGGAGSIFQILAEMYSYSGVTQFFDASGTSTVNDPKNVEFLARMAGLYKKDTPEADVTNDFPKMVAQFGTGKIAMMHHNLGSYNDHVKAHGADKIGAFALPVGPSGKRTVVANPVDGFAVFRNSEHKDAAWKFVDFLVSKEANSYWNSKTGQIPANTDAQQDTWVASLPHLKTAVDTLADPGTAVVSPPYYLPQFSSITKADTEPLFQKVLLGQMKPQAFLDTLARKLTDAQAEWKKAHGG